MFDLENKMLIDAYWDYETEPDDTEDEEDEEELDEEAEYEPPKYEVRKTTLRTPGRHWYLDKSKVAKGEEIDYDDMTKPYWICFEAK